MIEWVLKGYGLITCMKSMLGYYVIGKMRKGKWIKKVIERITKIWVFKSWKYLND